MFQFVVHLIWSEYVVCKTCWFIIKQHLINVNKITNIINIYIAYQTKNVCPLKSTVVFGNHSDYHNNMQINHIL